MPTRKPLHKWWIVKDCGYSSPCWIWQGHTIKNERTKIKYGLYQLYSRSFLAHRYVYEQYKGPIPKEMHLDHLCKITLCVNPDHLEIVTRTINNRRSENAKITLEIANEIRDRYSKGNDTQRWLAKVYNINQSTIQRIINGTLWK